MNKLKFGILIILLVSAFSLGKSVFTEGSKNNSKTSLSVLAKADDHDEEYWEDRYSEVLLGGD